MEIQFKRHKENWNTSMMALKESLASSNCRAKVTKNQA